MMTPYDLIRQVRFINFSIRLLIPDAKDNDTMGYILGREVIELKEYMPKHYHRKYWNPLIDTIEQIEHEIKMSFNKRIKND